jgi:hypothetical protein
MKLTREEVYTLINGERNYQDLKWGTNPQAKHANHSPEEWLTYIEDYLNEAKHILSREAYGVCEEKAMDITRKIAAMAVCAMEQNGAPARDLTQIRPMK